MAALESGLHRRDIADAFEGIVHAAISHVDDKLLNRPAVLLRADEIRGTQTLGHFEFVRVGIDGYDSTRLCHHQALDNTETDATQAEDGCGRTGSNFRGV